MLGAMARVASTSAFGAPPALMSQPELGQETKHLRPAKSLCHNRELEGMRYEWHGATWIQGPIFLMRHSSKMYPPKGLIFLALLQHIACRYMDPRANIGYETQQNAPSTQETERPISPALLQHLPAAGEVAHIYWQGAGPLYSP